MKKLTTKFITMIMICLLTITLIPVGTFEANAMTQKLEKKITLTLYPNKPEHTFWFYINNMSEIDTITNIKSSNTSVVKASKLKGVKNILILEPKRVGEAQISLKYKGKKYTSKIVVNRYENPCQQFKVGNRDYANKFNISNNYSIHGTDKISEKISIKPKKGWTIVKIQRVFFGSPRTVKNNSVVEFSSEFTGTGVYVSFKNKKTNVVQKVGWGYGNTGGSNYNWYD